MGNDAELEQHYQDAHEALPAAIGHLGMSLASRGEFEAAFDVVEQGARRFPHDRTLRNGRREVISRYGVRLAHDGQFDAALDVLESGAREFPNDPMIGLNLAAIRVAREQARRRRW
jgi:hypothetical protein